MGSPVGRQDYLDYSVHVMGQIKLFATVCGCDLGDLDSKLLPKRRGKMYDLQQNDTIPAIV